MTLFEELTRRGLIAQMTHEDIVKKKLDEEKTVFYIGFDATADSLHVGHFLQLMVINRMIEAGHTPILLLGTGTTMVGDPTGKTDMRKMLTVDEINYNADRFLEQMSRIVDIDKCIVARNGDWLMKMNYLELLRDVGVHFSVNKMLTAECFKSRLEKGLSFIEFNYMIMQSYDFLHLLREHNCTMQLGGNDQWSNIIGGVDLIRRVEGREVCGLTFTLLTTKEGKKMGKTENGAVWLDSEKTSPFEFFQYWRNVSDDDVINCLKLLTFVPIDEIEKMENEMSGSGLNIAKEKLAFELTKTVHGVDNAQKAMDTSKALFVSGVNSDDMPTTEVDKSFFDGGAGILNILVLCGLASSNGEARRLVQQGGILINDQKIIDPMSKLDIDSMKDGYLVIKKGKKIYHKISF